MGLDPVSWAVIGVGASLLGTGVSAYSSYQQGKSAQSLNNYNAALDEQNAVVAQRDAAIIANQQRTQNARIQAKQRAAFAANGVVGDTGSPLLVEAATAGNLEMGALETQRQGNIRAGQYRQQAELDRMSGKAARTAGNLNTAATLLQGAGSAASQYANYKTLS